jgi:hypothetical protein
MVEKRKTWMVSGEREREREGTYVRDVETVIDFVQNKQIIK